MTDIGGKFGNVTVPGVLVGIVGLAMTIVNYPIYKKNLKKRRDKYADQIIALSDKIMGNEGHM